MKIVNIVVFLSLFVSFLSSSQIDEVCGEDTVYIHLNGYEHSIIHWEKSIDNVNWTRINTENDTVLVFMPESEMFVRASITFAQCEPIYSGITHVLKKPLANAGPNRVVSNDMHLTANFSPNSEGIWEVITGSGTLQDNQNPFSEFYPNDSISILSWKLENVCGSSIDTIQIEYKNNEYVNTLVFVDETDSIYSSETEIDQGIFKIIFSEPVPTVSDSSILLGYVDSGFLRAVDSVYNDLDTLLIYTSQATLLDITTNGVYDVGQIFDLDTTVLKAQNSSGFKSLNHLPTRHELLTDSRFQESNYYYVVNDKIDSYPGVSHNLVAKNGNSVSLSLEFDTLIINTPNVTANLSGSYELTPNIVSDIDISFFGGLESFKFGMYNSVVERNYEVDINIGNTIDIFDETFNLFNQSKTVVLVLGGVPIPIICEFGVNGEFSVSVNGNLNVNVPYTNTTYYTSGIEYEGDLGWTYPYSQNSESSIDPSVTLSGGLEEHFEIGPRVDFKIFGIVGPYIDLRVLQDLDLCFLNDNWKGEVDVDAELTVGAKAKILGETLFDVSESWNRDLYETSFPSSLEITAGNNQSYTLGEELIFPIDMLVKSTDGFTVPLVAVRLNPLNGGSVTNTTVYSDLSGQISFDWIPGGSGESQLEVTILDCNENQLSNLPIYVNAFEATVNPNCLETSLALSFTEENDNVLPIVSFGEEPYEYSEDGVFYSTLPPVFLANPNETYTLYVKDALGCISSENYTVSGLCDEIELSLNAIVQGNSVVLNAFGGEEPYEFSFNQANNFSPQDTIENIIPGAYIAYVRDNFGCSDSLNVFVTSEEIPIQCNFIASDFNVVLDSIVEFVNLSNNANSFSWDFGDGSTSTDENPIHSYDSIGVYTITLIIENSFGTDTLIRTDYINVIDEELVLQNEWVQVTSNAPWTGRSGHTSVVFDEKMWIIGGEESNQTKLNDVWSSFDGINWIEETNSASWLPRQGHTSIVFNNKIWIFGGNVDPLPQGNIDMSDVWSSSDGINWIEETNSANWPRRSSHISYVLDNKLWIAGGIVDFADSYNDIWSSSDGVNWVQETASAEWTERYEMASYKSNDSVFLVNGWTVTPDASVDGPQFDIWSSFNGVDWYESQSNTPWGFSNAINALSFNDGIYVSGAEVNNSNFEFWTYNSQTWSQLSSNSVPARNDHTGLVFNNKIWILGGSSSIVGNSLLNDVWYYH